MAASGGSWKAGVFVPAGIGRDKFPYTNDALGQMDRAIHDAHAKLSAAVERDHEIGTDASLAAADRAGARYNELLRRRQELEDKLRGARVSLSGYTGRWVAQGQGEGLPKPGSAGHRKGREFLGSAYSMNRRR